MDRRTFIKQSVVAMGASGITLGATEKPIPKSKLPIKTDLSDKPNVLFILSDQHNAKVMGHLNHPDVKTPNFDRLANEGVRFNACITANPICTPSRVSFLSGQYCHNHGYYGLSGPNPHGLPNIIGHFRRHGYKTAAIGKIHCPAYWIEDDCDLFHDTCATSVDGRSAEYANYLEERNATQLEDHACLWEFGIKGGMQKCDGRASTISYRDGQEGWSVSKGIEFMKNCAQKDQRFFVHISLPKPHECYTPAKEFWDLYDESKLTLPPNTDYDLEGKAPHLIRQAKMWRKGKWTMFEPKTFEVGRMRKLHGYLGCVSHVDHAVGELMQYLKESGLEDNTIVVYSSDHGDYACEHDIMEKAPGICSDAITRVPSIWRWPGKIKANHAVTSVVETVDLAPTLCSLAGITMLETADGQVLSKMLKGEPVDTDRLGLTQFAWSKSVRKGPWRLVMYPKEMFEKDYPNGFGELYNIEDDPWEMKNLYFDANYADMVRSMERQLLEKLITTTRPATFHGSNYSAKETAQTYTEYDHTVNFDDKMHYSRLATIADKPFQNYL